MKLFKSIIFSLFLALIFGQIKPVYAFDQDLEAGSAADLATNIASIQGKDIRVEKLRGFLESQKSPLAPEAEKFVAEADRYNLDWKLVAAISGVESTFGQFIPTSSYNCWGWGVFTGTQSGVNFKDWDEGISEVSRGLRQNYMDRGALSVEQIGRWYAASPVWAWKVNFFLNKIDSFAQKPDTLDVVL